jgi:hypothetical protein
MRDDFPGDFPEKRYHDILEVANYKNAGTFLEIALKRRFDKILGNQT